jgi:hypothetical protein
MRLGLTGYQRETGLTLSQLTGITQVCTSPDRDESRQKEAPSAVQ